MCVFILIRQRGFSTHNQVQLAHNLHRLNATIGFLSNYHILNHGGWSWSMGVRDAGGTYILLDCEILCRTY